jgi:hypothetical protein
MHWTEIVAIASAVLILAFCLFEYIRYRQGKKSTLGEDGCPYYLSRDKLVEEYRKEKAKSLKKARKAK